MSTAGAKERVTQKRVIKLFTEQLGYTYLGNWFKRENNQNIEEEYLQKYLIRKGYSRELLNRAVNQLIKVANGMDQLYYVNKDVYSLLRYGAKVKEETGEVNQTVKFINWENPYDNDFYIAEEISIQGENDKRPDIVLYVNGIALGVIELKRSTVSVYEGIRQNLDSQSARFIKPFFHTMQLVMAGNDSEGLRYGTTGTKDKYYLTWKEDDKATDELSKKVESLTRDFAYHLDKQLVGLCLPERFLEIIHDFIVFDRGIKKVCRPNQYFGVKAAQARVKSREGGIVWHTQGSGKSLTMVWLTRWIKEHIPDSRILIITDRTELDEQIEKVYTGVQETIYRTKSGKDLLEALNVTTPTLIASLIHKFGKREDEEKEADYEEYIKDLRKNVPAVFQARGDIYVFVDECHRTQSGKLHEAMKAILPNALLIGFTGTPLLKKDKRKSIEVFGTYIHTYKFDEAVRDNVILDLQYEARNVEQYITSQDKIDQWFESKTRGLTDFAKVKLKQKWGTMQRLLSSKSRLAKIVNDIIFDMETKERLQNGRGNALLVAGSIYEACKYYELFQSEGFKKCAIITSYIPNPNAIKGESTGEDDETESIEKYEIYQIMLNGKTPEEFEKEVKKHFTDEPAQMKLLIVVDKLLTGFDAPSATYLYIDKKMQDHGLFQAICRVNRLDGDDKEYGYVIDYKDLFQCLEKSIFDYTSGAFDDYEKEDVQGLLLNRLAEAKERLDETLESLRSLCEPVPPPKDTLAFIRYFAASDIHNKEEIEANAQKRAVFYKYVVAFIRAYARIADEMHEAGYIQRQIEEIQRDVKQYDEFRDQVMRAAGDYVNLKSYEAAMRHLIDTYIGAEESEKISNLEDMTLIELIVAKGSAAIDHLPKGIRTNPEAVAETIENNVRRLIIEETPTNPKYYEKMSVLLEELIKERRAQVASYEEYLQKIIELTKTLKDPGRSNSYPKTINSAAKRALYDNLGQDETLALVLHQEIVFSKPDDWRSTKAKRKAVLNTIKKHIQDEAKAEEIYKIVEEQGEY